MERTAGSEVPYTFPRRVRKDFWHLLFASDPNCRLTNKLGRMLSLQYLQGMIGSYKIAMGGVFHYIMQGQRILIYHHGGVTFLNDGEQLIVDNQLNRAGCRGPPQPSGTILDITSRKIQQGQASRDFSTMACPSEQDRNRS